MHGPYHGPSSTPQYVSPTATVHGGVDDPSHPMQPMSTSEYVGENGNNDRYRYPEQSVKFSASPPTISPSQPGGYTGSGTQDDPYVVDWDLGDPESPYNWTKRKKWIITMQLALCTFTVSFGSSSYSGGLTYIMADLNVSQDVAVLGVSLYVLGFALGPLIFAPLGERAVFLTTLSAYTVLHLGGALGKNLPTLLSCRLLSGTVGASPLTNSGGVISDIWNARERGAATAIYATVPFLGPIVGPIIGGYLAQSPSLGWRFNFWLMMMLSAATLITGFLLTPETYTPVLLRWRAQKLMQASGGTEHYVSTYDISRPKSLGQAVRRNLSRPFIFLFTEPIVACLAIYVAIVYGTLYALFSAFPIIFQRHRGFSAGEGGLAFLGVGLGVVMGTTSTNIQNRFYWRAMDKSDNGRAPPEARLHMSIIGGVLCPIGLFWFAWTSQPHIHYLVSIFAGVPFGIGVAQILQGLTAYVMDAYGLYFASAIAATVVLRSIGGAIFPLFSTSMFNALGDQWAMSVFGFMSAVCMPMPIIFFKYGWWIRSKSKLAYHNPEPRSNVPSRPETVISHTDKKDATVIEAAV
ncbi:hypothetical protein EYR40_001122 [Pleurotus pulmonarius]|nr:hypothetical protein EYR38_004363 [Pleurotus pulmonarius]KAF4608775.1 hypothetical protein EYR40_001122 [Pleurotus pulmonarius]